MQQFVRRLLTGSAFVISVAFGVAPAAAADLPSRPQPVSMITPTPVYNWTGIYVGVNAGYTFGRSQPMSLFSDNFSAFEYDASGGLIGLTAGAQIQSGRTVIGVEADIDWANISGSSRGNIYNNGVLIGTATLSSKIDAISTIRTRVGYAHDNWLFYGTGGIAVTKDRSTLSGATFVCGGANPPCSSLSDIHLGLSAGAGVEYGFTPNVSAKAEYIWVGAGSGNTLKENMLRLGLNYRFGM